MDIAQRAKEALDYVESIWVPEWDDVWELTVPIRMINRNSPISSSKIHDSTASNSLIQLANVLLSGITPPWIQWFRLVPGTLVKGNDRAELMQRLDLLNNILYTELNASNFIQEMQSSYIDYIVGTGAMKIEADDEGGIRFSNIPLGEYAVEEGGDGKIKAFFYKRLMAGIDLKKEDSGLTDIEDDKTYKIIIAVETIDNKSTSTLILDEGTDVRQLRTQDIEYSPFIVFRWSKIPREVYGYGPAMLQHHDNRYLNKIKELAAKGFALDVGGVYTALDDGIINPYSVSLQPQSILTVSSNDRNNPSINRLDTGINVNLVQFNVESLRQDIRKGFLADRFSPPTGEKFTATEIVMRARLIVQELGGTYGIIEKELLRPLVDKIIRILTAQGKIPEGFVPDKRYVDVNYLSQLAQSQREGNIENIMKYSQFAQMFGQIDPRATLMLKIEDTMRKISEDLNLDSNLIRNKGEIQAIIQQAQQAQQAQQTQQATGE